MCNGKCKCATAQREQAQLATYPFWPEVWQGVKMLFGTVVVVVLMWVLVVFTLA